MNPQYNSQELKYSYPTISDNELANNNNNHITTIIRSQSFSSKENDDSIFQPTLRHSSSGGMPLVQYSIHKNVDPLNPCYHSQQHIMVQPDQPLRSRNRIHSDAISEPELMLSSCNEIPPPIYPKKMIISSRINNSNCSIITGPVHDNHFNIAIKSNSSEPNLSKCGNHLSRLEHYINLKQQQENQMIKSQPYNDHTICISNGCFNLINNPRRKSIILKSSFSDQNLINVNNRNLDGCYEQNFLIQNSHHPESNICVENSIFYDDTSLLSDSNNMSYGLINNELSKICKPQDHTMNENIANQYTTTTKPLKESRLQMRLKPGVCTSMSENSSIPDNLRHTKINNSNQEIPFYADCPVTNCMVVNDSPCVSDNLNYDFKANHLNNFSRSQSLITKDHIIDLEYDSDSGWKKTKVIENKFGFKKKKINESLPILPFSKLPTSKSPSPKSASSANLMTRSVVETNQDRSSLTLDIQKVVDDNYLMKDFVSLKDDVSESEIEKTVMVNKNVREASLSNSFNRNCTVKLKSNSQTVLDQSFDSSRAFILGKTESIENHLFASNRRSSDESSSSYIDSGNDRKLRNQRGRYNKETKLLKSLGESSDCRKLPITPNHRESIDSACSQTQTDKTTVRDVKSKVRLPDIPKSNDTGSSLENKSPIISDKKLDCKNLLPGELDPTSSIEHESKNEGHSVFHKCKSRTDSIISEDDENDSYGSDDVFDSAFDRDRNLSFHGKTKKSKISRCIQERRSSSLEIIPNFISSSHSQSIISPSESITKTSTSTRSLSHKNHNNHNPEPDVRCSCVSINDQPIYFEYDKSPFSPKTLNAPSRFANKSSSNFSNSYTTPTTSSVSKSLTISNGIALLDSYPVRGSLKQTANKNVKLIKTAESIDKTMSPSKSTKLPMPSPSISSSRSKRTSSKSPKRLSVKSSKSSGTGTSKTNKNSSSSSSIYNHLHQHRHHGGKKRSNKSEYDVRDQRRSGNSLGRDTFSDRERDRDMSDREKDSRASSFNRSISNSNTDGTQEDKIGEL